ncbi:MAG: DAHL domain-containing protein, partial [Gallionella sp.]
MKRSEILFNIMLVMAAIAAILALAFFYQKTQSVDLREQNEVFDLISELRVIDNRWDFEVQRARSDTSGKMEPINPNAGDKALRTITSIAQRTTSHVLSAGLTELRKEIQLKADLVEKFKYENSNSKEALNVILSNVTELEGLLADRKSPPVILIQALNRLAATSPQYYMQAADLQGVNMEAAAAQLNTAPEVWRDKIDMIKLAVQSMRRHRPLEQDLYGQLEVSTSGPRLVSMALAYNNELETTFEEKERY